MPRVTRTPAGDEAGGWHRARSDRVRPHRQPELRARITGRRPTGDVQVNAAARPLPRRSDDRPEPSPPMTRLTYRRRARRGFSLIELMTVMAVIGLLAALSVPRYRDMKRRA